jgi:DNA repair protein RecN (Recombination protein N)
MMSLRELILTHLAVFDSQCVDVPQGMTVIAGEAGAGKSLMIDAMDWIFGGHASAKEILRKDCTKGSAGLLYEITPQHDAVIWHALDAEGIELERNDQNHVVLEITRDFTPSGSRFRINGTSVSRAFMQSLRPYMLELQSQHSTITLMQQAHQQHLLDAYGGVTHRAGLEAVEGIFQQWKEAVARLNAYEVEEQQASHRLHVLRLQVEELERFQLGDLQEDLELEEEINRLAHAEQLQSAYAQGLELMGLGDVSPDALNVLDVFSGLSKRLSSVEASEKRLTPVLEQLDAIREQLREIGHQLNALNDEVGLNPKRLDDLQSRLNDLQKLKRLYGPTLADVIRYYENSSQELAELEFRHHNPDVLKTDVTRLSQHLKSACQALTQARQRLAFDLETQVQASLSDLAMPHARFKIILDPVDPYAQGQERVHFAFSANVGDELKPLGKVASGGELSRVLLALTVASLLPEAGEAQAKKLYVFDEIDTGTSGQAAKTIGLQLQRLAQAGHQVLVVTHQAVVAAAAHHHWWVHKHVNNGVTVSSVKTLLNRADVADLLTHLASGEDAQTQVASRQFAEALLNQMQPALSVVQ